MSLELEEKAMEILQKRGVSATCSRCGSNDWGRDLVEIHTRMFDEKSRTPGNFGYIPTIMMVCHNCGYVVHHILKEIGALG